MALAWTTTLVARVRASFEANRDPQRAIPMRAYMQERFDFLGLSASERRALQREALRGTPKPNERELTWVVQACWRTTRGRALGADAPRGSEVGRARRRCLRSRPHIPLILKKVIANGTLSIVGGMTRSFVFALLSLLIAPTASCGVDSAGLSEVPPPDAPPDGRPSPAPPGEERPTEPGDTCRTVDDCAASEQCVRSESGLLVCVIVEDGTAVPARGPKGQPPPPLGLFEGAPRYAGRRGESR